LQGDEIKEELRKLHKKQGKEVVFAVFSFILTIMYSSCHNYSELLRD